MKFNSPDQVRLLAGFKKEGFLTTSFYLDTDKSRLTKKEIAVSFKNLLSDGRTQLAALDVGKAKKDSLVRDLDRIFRFGAHSLSAWTAAGLALFACSGADYWEELSLPRAPRNHVVFDRSLYVRPLGAMLDEFRRICAFLLDRQEARWYEIYMGEIALLDTLKSEVPSRVREGGWQGYESKRIERHIDAHLHEHFKKAALKTFDLFKKNQFDWLFLGCKEEYRSDFEPLLHPYLKERLRGWLKTDSNNGEAKILKQALEVEKKLKAEEEEALAQALVAELEKGGRAVSGLKEVLRRLNIWEAQSLVVSRHFAAEGTACPKCHYLYVDEVRCPVCQIKTDKVQDIVHESVHSALDKKVQVRYVTPPSKLDRYGRIGAFLKYKT